MDSWQIIALVYTMISGVIISSSTTMWNSYTIIIILFSINIGIAYFCVKKSLKINPNENYI